MSAYCAARRASYLGGASEVCIAGGPSAAAADEIGVGSGRLPPAPAGCRPSVTVPFPCSLWAIFLFE